MSRVFRLGLLALKILPCPQRNASTWSKSYLSFFDKLVKVGCFKEVGLASLEWDSVAFMWTSFLSE